MKVVGGHFAFELPVAFHPDYSSHGITDVNMNKYDFNCEVRIISYSTITNLSLPKHAEILSSNNEKGLRTDISIKSRLVAEKMEFFYKTIDWIGV